MTANAKATRAERCDHARDVAAMDAVRQGDRDAFAGVYDRHSAAVYGLALRVLRHGPDAEAVVSDVFYELWRNPNKYDASRASLRSYLMTMTRCRAIDRVRASTTRADKTAAAREAAAPDWLDRQAHHTPERDAIVCEQGELVRAAVRRLDAGQRQALVLAYFQGMTHREIADELDKPLGTVKTWLRRALLDLRDALRNEAGGEP